MIELWSWPTPNGEKIHIALEELGLPYTVVPINIGAGEQFKPEFLAINPNHRIPAIVDDEGPGGRFTLFESGAILIYLAEKAGRLIPNDAAGRYTCLQWLMFQMGGIGPMFGQANHFTNYAPEKIPYAIDRYVNEAKRLVRVLEKRLAEVPYLAGRDYSIADIASFTWIASAAKRNIIAFDETPAVKNWLDGIAARPAVERGLAVLGDKRGPIKMSDEARKTSLGLLSTQQGKARTSFLKKRSKKLLDVQVGRFHDLGPKSQKFLVLFFKKRTPSLLLLSLMQRRRLGLMPARIRNTHALLERHAMRHPMCRSGRGFVVVIAIGFFVVHHGDASLHHR